MRKVVADSPLLNGIAGQVLDHWAAPLAQTHMIVEELEAEATSRGKKGSSSMGSSGREGICGRSDL